MESKIRTGLEPWRYGATAEGLLVTLPGWRKIAALRDECLEFHYLVNSCEVADNAILSMILTEDDDRKIE